MIRLWFICLCLFCLLIGASPVYAGGIPLIVNGAARTFFSVLQLPKEMLDSGSQSFPFGLIGGAITGTAKAVGGTIGGAADMARGAAPYAKYMIFLI